MIPYEKLSISPRHAKVLNGGLPTEQHGDHKKAFIDLKVAVLLEKDELNEMFATQGDPQPCNSVFNAADGNLLVLPDAEITAKLRDKITGQLKLKVGTKQLEFEGAHTVGAVNRVELINGGKGSLTLQFRFDPGLGAMAAIIEAIERAECVLGFEETEESVQAKDEKQAEMGV